MTNLRVTINAKNFGETPVLTGIDFSLATGARMAVLGPSGVGKSTLLRIIARRDTDFAGGIDGPTKLAAVFQEPTLLPWRSARENIALFGELDEDEIEEALEIVGLGGRGDAFPTQLSLGQQRRLALIRGFAHRPELLLMDEAFVSLDPKMADEMIAMTRDLLDRYKPSLILVTHNHDEARALTDQIYRLEGQPATLTAD